jgi:hypothetical protein
LILSYVKVRALYNERGFQIERATLSMPVQVSGWKTLPIAGEEVVEVESEVIILNLSIVSQTIDVMINYNGNEFILTVAVVVHDHDTSTYEHQ